MDRNFDFCFFFYQSYLFDNLVTFVIVGFPKKTETDRKCISVTDQQQI